MAAVRPPWTVRGYPQTSLPTRTTVWNSHVFWLYTHTMSWTMRSDSIMSNCTRASASRGTVRGLHSAAGHVLYGTRGRRQVSPHGVHPRRSPIDT